VRYFKPVSRFLGVVLFPKKGITFVMTDVLEPMIKNLTPDEAERMAIYERHGDTIVDRQTLAAKLNISTKHLSELVKKGWLQVATRNPLRFSLEHNIGCYENYRFELARRAPGVPMPTLCE
jgi:hypothetical protein